MKELHLKNSDLKAIVDDDDFDHLSKFSWKLCNGYAVSCKKYYKLHNIVYGFNQDLTVDHINNNKLDNRKENLRWATRKQQNQNKKPYKGRKFKGVYKRVSLKGKVHYIASITSDGITTQLGKFTSEYEAAKAYDIAAKLLHKEFANLNFPKLEFFGDEDL